MVESWKADGSGPDESQQVFPESVNVPLMASINLSSIFLDPNLAHHNLKAKEEVKEYHEQSVSYWGDNKIRNIDDLMLEMENDAANDDDNDEDDEVRNDSSDGSDNELEKEELAYADAIKQRAARQLEENAGMSVAEM